MVPICDQRGNIRLTRTADPSYVASTNTDVNGDYKFTGLTPDGYAVSAGHMAYQPKTANVTVTAGGDVDKDFVLDPVAANIKADVVSLDQSSGGKTGGWRSVQVKITYQMMCHGPMRLVVWAWGGSPAKPYVIHDSSGTGGYDYSCWLDSTVSPNVTTSGFDTVATLRFPWNTTWVPNGSYTIKAALKCSDPHKDGVDENPDPVAESWVHWAGSPPTATADGTAGGTTLSIGVTNLVITSYRAKDTPLPSHDQDAFLYDPDAASPLCNPSFEVSIDNWATEPMVIRVWMAATAWSDTRPVPDYDPYVDLDVNAAGTYTLTWDGSNPGYPYWEGEWGTWSFDVDLYRLDATATWAIDHFYAKTHDGQSENYDVLVDPVNHHVWWYCDETTTPPGYQFRCNYIVHSDESTQPTAVDLVTLKELTVKATQTGPVTLNTLHDNITTFPGPSSYTNEDDTLGTWRTVFTGQTASGAEHRRDHTNPRILATNQTTLRWRAGLRAVNFSTGRMGHGKKVEVIVDGTSTRYSTAKEWLDKLDEAGNAPGIQLSKGDVRAPMCFWSGSDWAAEAWFPFSLSSPDGVQIRGESVDIAGKSVAGFVFPARSADWNDGRLHYPYTQCGMSFPEEVKHYELLTIAWSLKVGDAGWSEVGQSANEVFVIAWPQAGATVTPYRLWRTLLFHATRGGGAAGNLDSILSGVWTAFKDRDVCKWKPTIAGDDGLGSYSEPLHYYLNVLPPPDPLNPMSNTALTALIVVGDGDCGQWTTFYLDCLAAHGLAALGSGADVWYASLSPPAIPGKNVDRFVVKDPMPGQNTPAPATRDFGWHLVARRKTASEYVEIWDPSYGITWEHSPSVLPFYTADVVGEWLEAGQAIGQGFPRSTGQNLVANP